MVSPDNRVMMATCWNQTGRCSWRPRRGLPWASVIGEFDELSPNWRARSQPNAEDTLQAL